jgi:hypothetical protein
MEKIQFYASRVNQPQVLKLITVVVTLIALAVAGGAPGAGSGIGGH